MTESTKTILIIGGVALVGWLAYQKLTTTTRPSPLAHPGTGQNIPTATGVGSGGETGFWNQLGNIGQGLNGAVSSVESTYNNVYDLFGGSSTTTDTGQGNNGTAG